MREKERKGRRITATTGKYVVGIMMTFTLMSDNRKLSNESTAGQRGAVCSN